MPFDPEVFGVGGGFDADVFSTPKAKESRQAIAERINNDAISQGARSFPSQGSDALGGLSQTFLNGLGGFVRGAGSIGATLARPFESGAENDARRAGINENMQTVGAQPDSFVYGLGKLGAEIAGTAPLGGIIGKAVGAVAPTLGTSIATGGFRTSASLPALPNIATRAAGGAISGGAMAGAVSPEDAGTGALIGGALPIGTLVAGKAGAYLRGAGSNINPEITDTARRSMEAGYVIPPSQVNPSFRNRTIESLSGKYETAQMASTRNQQVTDNLVRRALGLPEGAPLTQEALDAVRKQAGGVYQQLKGTGTVVADKAYGDALDKISQQIKSATASFPQLGKTNMHGEAVDEIGQLVSALKQPQFDAGGAVDAISVLRDKADSAFASGDKQLGRASKAAASALEDMLDRHLQQIGAEDLLPAYRDARALIAKSYTVGKGLREGAGTVDARALARELQRGKPPTGDLRTVAEFGNVFNKAAQPPHLIGSPAVNALKPMLSLATSGIGGATMGPIGLTLGALNYALPPVARAYMFSPGAQKGLLGSGAALLDESVPMGLLSQGASRALPLLSAQ